jgi:hypothetical protein
VKSTNYEVSLAPPPLPSSLGSLYCKLKKRKKEVHDDDDDDDDDD